MVQWAQKVCDDLWDLIVYADKFFVRNYNNLDLFLSNNYNFSLKLFANDIEVSINSFYSFLNKIPGVSQVKELEDFLNHTGSYHKPRNYNFSYYDFMLTDIVMNLALLYIIIFSLLFFINLVFFITKVDRELFFLTKIIVEKENNLSNFLDVKRLIILFIFLLNIIISLSFVHFGFKSFYIFSVIVFLNIITLSGYLYTYNINIYVFIKGLFAKLKVNFNFIIDNITLSIFISRLLLQFIRLLICSAIFFLFHEMSIGLLQILVDHYVYITLNNNGSVLGFVIKTIIEYLDMTINFTTQYSIYIVSVMWLIPFLFTFIKKFLKINNR